MYYMAVTFLILIPSPTKPSDSSKCALELSCAKTGVYFILYIELALELLQYKCTLQLQWIGWRGSLLFFFPSFLGHQVPAWILPHAGAPLALAADAAGVEVIW